MIKKLLALLLTINLALLPILGTAASGETVLYQAVSALDSISRDMVIPALPFLSTNNGLDMLETALEKEMNGEDPGLIMGPAIRTALQYTDAETLKKLIASLRLFSENFRGNIQICYQRPEVISLTAAETEGADSILKYLTQKDDRLPATLEKHQLSAGVVANMLLACAEENGSQPLLRLVQGNFELNDYNKTLCSALQVIWPETDFVAWLQDLTHKLNESFNTTEKTSVATFLKRTNLLKTDSNSTTGGSTSDGNGGSGNGGSQTGETSSPSQTPTDTFAVEKDGVVRRSYTGIAPVVYRVENGVETPVKMALYIEGQIVAKLMAGQYVIRESSPYFTDCDTWGKPYVEALYARGIVNGRAERCFMPTDTITREEFVKLIVEMLDLTDSAAVSNFSDVLPDAWYASCVASAEKNGLINGISDTEFGVGDNIKRQDMAKIISTILEKQGITSQEGNAAQLRDYDQIAAYAQLHVLNICRLGIVSGDETQCFHPMQFASRQEAAKMIYGMIEALLKTA